LTQAAGEGSAATEVEPKAYVDALLEVHARNQETVNRDFKSEAGFVASLDRACKDFVNKNAATGTSTTKSPELLAKHADALLRKSNKVSRDEELEDALNKVMILFKYIEDKDVFQTLYTTKLSKRFMHGVSVSGNAEASMIAKLKEACGVKYTNKLQRMLTDVSLSKKLTEIFKEKMAQTDGESELDVSFSVMVLGIHFWPLTAPTHEFVIPKDILPTGRKLTWLWNYSKNELRTNYLKEQYILTCSSYQMAILVQYNDHETLSLGELLELTGISKESLVQLLGVLVKAKILINEEQDQYGLNPSYESKTIRVTLNLPIKNAESAGVHNTVDEYKTRVILIAITKQVGIIFLPFPMVADVLVSCGLKSDESKKGKEMKNQQLIQEVIARVSQHFTPRVSDIKKTHMSSLPTPGADADLAEVWSFLKEGMDYMMMPPNDGVSYHKYMDYYAVAYNCCTMSGRRASQNNLIGSDIYNHLIAYFTAYLKHIRDATDNLQGEALLQYYANEWDRYATGANHINRIFTHLNRHWIKRESDEGRKGVYTVYTLALVRWRQDIFLHIQNKSEKLSNAVLRLIVEQRNGKTIDAGLVKRVVSSFASLSLKDADSKEATLDVYKDYFETPLINTAEKYYKRQSELFPAESSFSGYLKQAAEWLKEEEDHVEQYMSRIAGETFLGRCAACLVGEHAGSLRESFKSLLDFDKDGGTGPSLTFLSGGRHVSTDLRSICALLARTPGGLEPLRKKFEGHVKEAGLTAVAKLTQATVEGNAATEVEPKAYFDALLEIHTKYQETASRGLRGEVGFVASFDRACKDFVNKNAVTGPSSTKSPELLAKHADALLRKNNKIEEDNDLAEALNKVMILFKYIVDKDVFQKFYAAKLSKRLIHGASASDEAEASMIAKLKEECGFDYTNGLERMFADMSLSKDLMSNFKEKMAQAHDGSELGLSFSIMVLSPNFWPLTAPTDKFVIPKDILPTYERFTRYYGQRHQGRKLTWLWNYSKNEVRTKYLKEEYVLTCSSYQMAVLVQYNDHDTLSLDELLEATGISREILVQVLGVLVKTKILIVRGQDQYNLNPGEVKAESVDVLKTVHEDRKYAIEAAIVRVMKAQKRMKNQQLIQEVVIQISQRFTPQVPDIKKAIDSLIEKEYLERVEGEGDLLRYLA
ncbi:hypothetical protein FRC01_001784, partial [Tulasnella sp. 417]